MSQLLFYLPVMFASLVVLEMCREDDAKKIVKRSAIALLKWTAFLVGASGVVYLLQTTL